MSWRIAVGAAAVMAVLIIAIFTLYVRERAEANGLRQDREAVCRRMKIDLETLVSWHARNSGDVDLRARLRYLHLNQGLTQLCLESELPVDASNADACWVMSGNQDCYVDVARKLLDLYEARSQE